MKYIAKLSLILSLTAISAFSQNIAPQIEKLFFTSDTQLKIAFEEGIKNAQKFEAPTPVSLYSDFKNSTEVVDPYIYLPIFNKMVYEYEYTSTEFVGTKKVILEFKGYSEKDSTTAATITYYNKKEAKTINFSIKVTQNSLFATDSILSGDRIELPIPLFKNKEWTENSNKNRVTSINSKVQVPAGNFENCVKVYTRIGGGDAGSAERYYAPGIGLIMENINGEDKQESIKLISYKKL